MLQKIDCESCGCPYQEKDRTVINITFKPNQFLKDSERIGETVINIAGVPKKFESEVKDFIFKHVGECAFDLKVRPLSHRDKLDMKLFWQKLEWVCRCAIDDTAQDVANEGQTPF